MSLYYVQKLLYQLNRDAELRRRFAADAEPVLAACELTARVRNEHRIRCGDAAPKCLPAWP